MATITYALRFIAGRYKGGEFPLRPNREIVVGRGSEFDMVLDEDMVSRRHAKIATYHGQIVLQDLKSTNGTFVNGKVLVGTSIMELVLLEGSGSLVPRDSAVHSVDVPNPDLATVGSMPAQRIEGARVTIDRAEGMSGRFPDDDITLADMIELFVGSGRTGVLMVTETSGQEGRIFFRKGTIYYATLAVPSRGGEAPPDLGPEKALFRLLSWPSGEFRMDLVDPPPAFDNELEADSRSLLVEAMRQYDELKRYEEHLPTREQRLLLDLPLQPALSALSAEALDTMQLVINHADVGLVLDHSQASDLETWQDLLYLIQNGYLLVE